MLGGSLGICPGLACLNQLSSLFCYGFHSRNLCSSHYLPLHGICGLSYCGNLLLCQCGISSLHLHCLPPEGQQGRALLCDWWCHSRPHPSFHIPHEDVWGWGPLILCLTRLNVPHELVMLLRAHHLLQKWQVQKLRYLKYPVTTLVEMVL